MGTSYNKLVRDKISEILDAKGITYEQRVASDAEYRQELIQKLAEEVQEFVEASVADDSKGFDATGATSSSASSELADVIEVLEALKKLPEFAGVERLRQEKLAEYGGFEERRIVKGEDNRKRT